MEAAIIIAIVVVVIAIAFGIYAWYQSRLEHRRTAASEHRDMARLTEFEADQQTAAAEERAARAKREQLAAQEQQLQAAQRRQDAEDLQSRADELDPDGPVEAEARRDN